MMFKYVLEFDNFGYKITPSSILDDPRRGYLLYEDAEKALDQCLNSVIINIDSENNKESNIFSKNLKEDMNYRNKRVIKGLLRR